MWTLKIDKYDENLFSQTKTIDTPFETNLTTKFPLNLSQHILGDLDVSLTWDSDEISEEVINSKK